MIKDPDEKECGHRGVTRRGFIASIGAGTVVAVAGAASTGATEPTAMKPEDMATISLVINQQKHKLLVEPRWSLLFVLREKLGLTGTKLSCERGECGSCTVLVDGVPQYACMILAVEAEGREITTIEGLMKGEDLGPVQQAFVEHDALQCGYCTPGQIMAVEGLLRNNPKPDEDQIRLAVSGNTCRCGSYMHIFRAVQRAAELKAAKGGA